VAIRITCPACEATYAVDDGLRGKRIRCKKCEELFAVQPGDEEDRPRPERRDPAQPVPKSPVRRPRDEDEDERPSRRPARDRDDDEEAPERRPPSRVRLPRDEDGAPRRRSSRESPSFERKPEKGGMSTGLLVGICGGAMLLVGLLVGGVLVALVPSGASSNSRANATSNTVDPVAVAGDPQNPPGKKEGAAPLPGDLGPEDLRRVKEATVYLRVDLPGGGIAEGTGFFAAEPGVIVTNAHVLGMLTADSVAPRSVTVQVHHGEPKEFRLKGLVLGVDRTNDLAVLRTEAAAFPLPLPLKVEPASGLIEAQKVWVFGFPFGRRLGKNITVSASSVSSLRKDAAGAISRVQVNGGMHPGNSGGPVANSRGEVVGVSVSGIQGTQINFAIPGDFVTRVLAGGIYEQEFGTPVAAGEGRVIVPVRLTTLDPLRRVREVRLDVWSGPPGEAVPATDKEPQAKPGDGPRQRVAAKPSGGGYTADVPLPPLPPGQVYWSRPMVTDAAGVTTWAAARTVPFDPALVVERRPADLRFKVPTAPLQRTLHVTNNSTVKFFGGGSAEVESNKMDGYMLEVSFPDTRGLGTGIRLHLDQPRFSREAGGEVVRATDSVSDHVSLFCPTYLVAGNNSVREFGLPNFDAVRPENREMILRLFEAVCNSWEATALPFPNRTLQPQETWPAHIPMLVRNGPRKVARAINVTCTYEGMRTVKGIALAHVRFAGTVNGTGRDTDQVHGKVAGHAVIDVNAQLLAQVKTTISYEADAGEDGLRTLMSNETIIDRVDGNTRGIEIPEALPRKVSPPGWRLSIARNSSFSIMFPPTAAPILSGTEEITDKNSPMRLTVIKIKGQVNDGPGFAASRMTVLSPEVPGKVMSGKQRLEWFRDRVSRGSKVSGEKSIALGRLPGTEFLVERPGHVSRYRVFSHLDRYYVVEVIGRKEQVMSKDADQFLDSFVIPPSVTDPIVPKPKGEK
jgi:predicted Zn finger-like uncharacterized protein